MTVDVRHSEDPWNFEQDVSITAPTVGRQTCLQPIRLHARTVRWAIPQFESRRHAELVCLDTSRLPGGEGTGSEENRQECLVTTRSRDPADLWCDLEVAHPKS